MRQPITVCANNVLELRFSKNNALFIVLQLEQTTSRKTYQSPIFAYKSL